MILYAPIVFLLEFIVSYLLNAGSIVILIKKPSQAACLSALTNACTWTSFYIIGKISDWSILLILCASCGDILGDYLTALRWPTRLWKILNKPQKRKKKLERIPVMTA